MLRTLTTLTVAALLAFTLLAGCEETTPTTDAQPSIPATPLTPATPVPAAPADAKLAPALTFDTVYNADGMTFESLRESKKVILLDFFAVWCGPCITSFPHLAEIQEHYGDRLQVVSVTDLQGMMTNHGSAREQGISPERERELMNTFIAHNKITWPVAFVPEREVSQSYGIRSIPHVVLIDTDGHIRFRGHPSSVGPAIKALLGD